MLNSAFKEATVLVWGFCFDIFLIKPTVDGSVI